MKPFIVLPSRCSQLCDRPEEEPARHDEDLVQPALPQHHETDADQQGRLWLPPGLHGRRSAHRQGHAGAAGALQAGKDQAPHRLLLSL